MSSATWLAAIWAVGAALSLVPVAVALVGLVGHTLRATPAGAVEGVPVLQAAVPTPLTWGVLRPMVLLPQRSGWSDSDRALVLAHEVAHVARGDWLVHIAARLVCSLIWFHPLAWLCAHQLRVAAEDAVDDAVLAKGARPSAYASLLLSLGTAGPSVALGMGSSAVGSRIRRVLAGGSGDARGSVRPAQPGEPATAPAWRLPRPARHRSAAEPPGGLMDPHGITRAGRLIAEIRALTGNTPPEVYQRIQYAHDYLHYGTQGAWPVGRAFEAWHDTLQALRPSLTHPEDQATVDALVHVVDALLNESC